MVIDIRSFDYVHLSDENAGAEKRANAVVPLESVFDYSGKQRMTAKSQPILESAGNPLLEPVAQRALLPFFPGNFD